MSSNGLLSALSLVVAVVLLAAALRGPRPASTVMIVLGVLFLVSAPGGASPHLGGLRRDHRADPARRRVSE